MVAIDESTHINIRGEGRERILDEARDQFLVKGFAATSMQEIADAVGLTKPALYYHFKDKQDLLLAVLGREMTLGRQAFLESLSAKPSLAARLEDGAIWCFSRIKGDLGRLMSDMHRVLPAERAQQFKREHPMPVDMVLQILEQGKESGELTSQDDPDVLARLFMGLIFGQLAMQCSNEMEHIDPEQLGKVVARVFTEGICRG